MFPVTLQLTNVYSILLVFYHFNIRLADQLKSFFFFCCCCRCMLKTSNHAGIESYIIKNIRNQFEFSMKVRKTRACIFYLIIFSLHVKCTTSLLQWGNANEWFLGTEFISLMRLVLCLPQGAETDLLSSMDKWVTRKVGSRHKPAHLSIRCINKHYYSRRTWSTKSVVWDVIIILDYGKIVIMDTLACAESIIVALLYFNMKKTFF